MSLKLALGEREWNDSRNFRKSASIDVQPYADFYMETEAILLDIMMIYLLGRDSRTNILEYSYYHRVVDTRNSLPRNTSVGQQVLILVK